VARRLKVSTQALGTLEVFAIREENSLWEPYWEPVRNTRVGDLVSKVPATALEHALHGWSVPFEKALELPPAGCLHKLALTYNICERRRSCSSWHFEACNLLAKNMPICFQPRDLPSECGEIVRFWRESVYCIVVLEGC
jgi:hypothetical protein